MVFTTTVSTLGGLLRVWREDAGMTVDEVAVYASEMLPLSHSVSRATLYRYELNQFPRRGPDALVLAAVAAACGRRQSEIPEQYRGELSALNQLLRKPCFPTSALNAA